MFQKERRREQRYQLQHAASARLLGGNGSEVAGFTQNASTRSLLLRCEALIPLRSKVEVIVRLPKGLLLKGTGEVLRVEEPSSGSGFLIAVQCETPLEVSRLS